MRIPRWLGVVLVVLGSLLFAWLLTLLQDLAGLDLGPGLTVAASSALLAVTWVYVRHTKASLDTQRDLLEAEIRQHMAQQKSAHYAAVSKLWTVALGAEDAITDIEFGLRAAQQAGQELDAWVEAATDLAEAARRLRGHTGRLMELVVEVDEEIENLTVTIVGSCLDLGTDVMRFSTLVLVEARESRTAGREFSSENLIREWEAPEDEGDRSAVRFADFLSGRSAGALDDQFTDYRVACRAEVRARSAA